MWNGDSLQLAADYHCDAWFSPTERPNAVWLELGFCLTNDGKQVAYCWPPDPSRLTGVPYAVARTGDTTTYEVFIPAKSFGAASLEANDLIGFGFLVNDNDGAGRRGWLQFYRGIGYGKDPRQFGLLILDQAAR